MTRLTNRYNWGNQISIDSPELYRQLNEVYEYISNSSNNKSSKRITTSDPSASSQINKEFDIGDLWINTSSDSAWIMTSRTTAEDVTWTIIT